MRRALPFFIVLTAAAAAGSAQEPAAEQSDTATELFRTFVEIRHSVGNSQHSDPRFFTREWLERAIRGALASRSQPDRPGLNWVEDSLLTQFGLGLTVDRIYSYKLLNETSGRGDLEMHVTYCNSPSTLAVSFVSEDGAWRVRGTKSDSTKKTWYRPDLAPLVEFEHIDVRDRSRYFNEGNLGTALGLDVKSRAPCAGKGV
jgi:hypothetical protein